MKLFCLPWAGGVAASYTFWAGALRPLQVIPLELPGRGRCLGDPVSPDFASMLEYVWAQNHHLFEGNYAFFGHSMGGVLAYELTRRILAEDRLLPACLVLSGCSAPNRRSATLSANMPDHELTNQIGEVGGTPRELLEDSQFLKEFLSLLKKDLRVLESYRWTPGPSLSLPVVALAGRHDSHAPLDAIAHWREYVHGDFAVREYDGGHFYFKRQLPMFLSELKSCVLNASAPSIAI